MDIFWPSWQRTSKINLICVTWYVRAAFTYKLICNAAPQEFVGLRHGHTYLGRVDLSSRALAPRFPSLNPHLHLKRKRRTGHAESDELLDRVTRCACCLSPYCPWLTRSVNEVTFQSGVLTSGWAVSSLVLFVRFQFAIVASYDTEDRAPRQAASVCSTNSACLAQSQATQPISRGTQFPRCLSWRNRHYTRTLFSPHVCAFSLIIRMLCHTHVFPVNFRLKPANDPESAGDSLAGPSEGPEKVCSQFSPV